MNDSVNNQHESMPIVPETTKDTQERSFMDTKYRVQEVIPTMKTLPIAAIHNLPTELLVQIFLESVEIDSSPWMLVAVCRGWRQIALAVPALWTHLSVYEDTKVVSGPLYQVAPCQIDENFILTIGRKSICWSVEDVHFFANRTGGLGLNVEYTSHSQDFGTILNLLVTDLAPRMKSFTISCHSTEFCTTGLDSTEFSSLESLTTHSVRWKPVKTLLEFIVLRSPRLLSLTTNTEFGFLSHYQFWSSLRALDLRNSVEFGLSEQLNEVIGKLHRIETLDGCPPNWPDESTPQVVLHHLQCLNVQCQPEFLARLQLPALQKMDLEISMEVNSRAHLNGSYQRVWDISLPSMVSLSVKSTDVVWLSRLSAPEIRTLSWTKYGFLFENDLSFESRSLFPENRLTNLQDLICDAVCSSEVLISALKCAPLVQNVVFAPGGTIDPPNSWALGVLEGLADQDRVLCPRLRRLTLGLGTHYVRTDRLTAIPLINYILEWRKNADIPLEYCEVIWECNGDQETVQYAWLAAFHYEVAVSLIH